MDAQRVRQQLDRILTSAAFADAGRAGSFLRFVVERTLDGHTAGIKESVIAVEVLNRPASFDSKSDPIVRVEAGRLRARLTSYYEAEGEADTVLISLPKGGYVPEFIERRLPGAAKIPGVLRLSILPPEDLSFDSFAVSPDGRKLAFTAFLKGRDVLWVRALDSLEAKPLMGTDGASLAVLVAGQLNHCFLHAQQAQSHRDQRRASAGYRRRHRRTRRGLEP